MPAHKKPKDKLQRRNKPHVMDPQVVAMNTEHVPSPPAEISDDLVAEWNELWTSQLGAYFNVSSDLPILRRLFTLRHRVDDFERIVLDGAGPETIGSAGQINVHPLLRVAQSTRAEILQLEDRCGLNPMARMRLGIALGQAHQSLDDMNRRITEDTEGTAEVERPDPRLVSIDTATG